MSETFPRLEAEGSVQFSASLLVILGSGSLPASSSVCRILVHGTEGNSLFGLVVLGFLGFFFKEIHHMQLHGLSVHSAASTPSTGIFEPVS